MVIRPALCPCCGEYGDIRLYRFRSTNKALLICTECDLLWISAEMPIDNQENSNADTFLKENDMNNWDAFQEIGPWPRP